MLIVAQDGTGDFTTLSEALDFASAYDTIAVGPGTYAPSTGERLPYYLPTGITVVGAGPDDTVFDAEGEPTFGFAYFPDILISGMTWTNATDHAFLSDLGTLGVEDCAFVSNANALYLGEGSYVEDTSFIDNRDSTYPSASVIDAIGPIRIENVYVEESPSGWITVVVQSGDERTVVRGLTVIGGGSVDLYYSGPFVENIVMLGSSGSYSAPCLSVSGWLSNSTVLGCTAELGIAVQAGFARNNLIAHNAGIGLDSSYAAYNLLFANAGGDFGGDNGQDWTNRLSNLTDQDPLFREFTDDGDWSNDDLRLSEGSPAIDAASADFPATDIEGTPRPQDGDGDGRARADIGAYEWGQLDADGDGWYADGGDCDDSDPAINPGVDDIPYNGIDEDCDGADLTDVDDDGHDADHQGGDDCDDTNADIHPGAWDIPDNGIDEDCDGLQPVDTDGDGWPDDQDCAPEDAAIHFGADEQCNGVDDNCDGAIDEDACDEVEEVPPTKTEANTCGCQGCRATPAEALLLPLLGLIRRRRSRG